MNQEVIAKLRFLRMGPRKVRLITDLVKGRKALRARDILTLTNKRAALPILKLLNSAIANAKNNFKLDEETLFIKNITVDGGPMLKRWMPKAHGRATPIRQRTSHVTMILKTVEKREKSATSGKAKK
ncbi:MAG TPA: 50S ribosomal protein L22 [Candidatus Magasanikbacteria bacterium]|nr:50S ribosomal protein L22 [Candidatus Magasanikbacteria bacterium]